MRLCFCLVFFVLSSCTSAHFPEVLLPVDQRLFMQGMEQLQAKREPEAFAVLQQNHPDSPWVEKANTVQKLRQDINHQQQRIADQQQLIDDLQRQHEKCRQQDEILRQQRDALEGDLQRLKQLLIDLEIRR